MNYTYWPMDYPPLCAYTHWFWSQIISVVQPDAIKYLSSYGYSSPAYRTIMRIFLILSELIVFVPAAILVLEKLYPRTSKTTQRIYLLILLSLAPLVYIDHAHFQPNAPMHGLVLWGAYFMMNDQLELAVIAMVLALNFKQMALYFALPFAFYALAKVWNRTSGRREMTSRILSTATHLVWLGIVFLVTLAIVWLPWVMETVKDHKSPHGIQSILQRIFPVKRGLFQAHLASFWSVASNFYDVNNNLTQSQQIVTALALTVAASLPSCLALLRRPTDRNFILSLFAVSLAFYLFSFHVHEKQILCPTVFFGLAFPEVKQYFTPFVLTATFNLLELVQREKNEIT